MKNDIKKLLGIIIIIILTATCTVVAQTLIKSNEVTYDNSKSKGSFDSVQESLDELYQKAGYTGEEYHEEILHGAYPVLSGELIPVYLADNGDVYYANTHTSWYSYEYKRWANAVILVDDAYTKYSVGQKIDEKDIESYFVWIPRYAYKLWNLGTYDTGIDGNTLNNKDFDSSPKLIFNTRIIEIVFGTKSYLDNLGYKKLIRNPETGEFKDPEGLAIDDYLEHPAFTLGDTELNGFWMGKFETGYNQTNTGNTSITGVDKWTSNGMENVAIDSSKIVIKPDVFSWRYLNVYNMFTVSKGYNDDLKSHMLKNTEWGAVAYLSHSAFGKGSEININNTKDFKTGYSAAPNTNQINVAGDTGLSTSDLTDKYNTSVGYLASTTGNITGIYDMSGCAWEYVAATMISGRTTDTSSGFSAEKITAEMKAGYIDVYPETSWLFTYYKRILGDATGELGPFYSYYEKNGSSIHSSWYFDHSAFVEPNVPWFHRGAGYTEAGIAGAFFFGRNPGSSSASMGFRLALAPSIT